MGFSVDPIKAMQCRSLQKAVLAGHVREIRLRTGAQMRDHLGSGHAAEPRAGGVIEPLDQTGKEAGGKEIAGTGGIDHALDRMRLDALGGLPGHHQGALLGAGNGREEMAMRQVFIAQGGESRILVGGLVQRLELVDIGKEDIDMPLAHQAQEFLTETINTEGIRQGQRHTVARAMGDLDGLAESVLCILRIPQVTFQDR